MTRHSSESALPAGLPAVKLHAEKLKAHHMEFREDPAKARSLRSRSWHAQNFRSHMVKCCLRSNPLTGVIGNIGGPSGAEEKLLPAVSQQIVNYREPSKRARDASANSRVSKKATRETSVPKE